jgi:Tol biopolymer transport system component
MIGLLAGCASTSIVPSARTSRSPSPTEGSPERAATSAAPVAAPPLMGTVVYSDAGDVYRFDLPDGPAVRLTDDPADEFDPDLSPDGTLIAYRMANGDGDQADIWVMTSDGSQKRDLTGDATLSNWAPAWSPDGTRLCFNSTRGGLINRLWTMSADGASPQPVTDDEGEYCDWSPDGTRLVYASAARARSYDLRIVSIDGSGWADLTSMDGTEFFPAWSPDGRWIAFEHLDDGVWLIRPDGSDARALGEGGNIVWSPTGLLGFDRPGGFALVDPDRLTLASVGLHIGRFPSWVALGEG